MIREHLASASRKESEREQIATRATKLKREQRRGRRHRRGLEGKGANWTGTTLPLSLGWMHPSGRPRSDDTRPRSQASRPRPPLYLSDGSLWLWRLEALFLRPLFIPVSVSLWDTGLAAYSFFAIGVVLPFLCKMSRYDDRYRGSDRRDDRGGGGGGYRGGGGGGRGADTGPDAGATRLYVGRLSTRTRSRDLEDLFAKYGRVRDVDVKHDFAFVEFADARDADDARHYVNGKDFDGNRLIVEFARRGPRGASGGAREYLGRGPPPGTGRCYNCGNDGHWARDCKAGDWRDKCYRCGQRGHIERNCRNSPRPTSSPSRSRSRSPRGHKRSSRRSVSRSRSRSFSRSPPRRGRSPAKADRSPMKDDRSPAKGDRRKSDRSKSRSLTPLPKDEKRSLSPSPVPNGRSISRSPGARSPSPEAHRGEQSPPPREKRRSISPSPEQDLDKGSPAKDLSPLPRRSLTPEEE